MSHAQAAQLLVAALNTPSGVAHVGRNSGNNPTSDGADGRIVGDPEGDGDQARLIAYDLFTYATTGLHFSLKESVFLAHRQDRSALMAHWNKLVSYLDPIRRGRGIHPGGSR